jgi:hypothetical protein
MCPRHAVQVWCIKLLDAPQQLIGKTSPEAACAVNAEMFVDRESVVVETLPRSLCYRS